MRRLLPSTRGKAPQSADLALVDETETGTTSPPLLTPSEERAERIARVLDAPLTVAGFAFLLVLVVEAATQPGTPTSRILDGLVWFLWAMFVVEFLVRLVVARSTTRFLRRNWWQIIFLAVPFLRFLRVLSRTARIARIGSSSVRSSRTAIAKFGSRLALLAVWTTTMILSGSTALFELGDVRPMADALYVSALAAITGQPAADVTGWARLVVVVLVLWSAVGFAALAGTIGAYFLEYGRREET